MIDVGGHDIVMKPDGDVEEGPTDFMVDNHRVKEVSPGPSVFFFEPGTEETVFGEFFPAAPREVSQFFPLLDVRGELPFVEFLEARPENFIFLGKN
jgi:hypothetical protein